MNPPTKVKLTPVDGSPPLVVDVSDVINVKCASGDHLTGTFNIELADGRKLVLRGAPKGVFQ